MTPFHKGLIKTHTLHGCQLQQHPHADHAHPANCNNDLEKLAMESETQQTGRQPQHCNSKGPEARRSQITACHCGANGADGNRPGGRGHQGGGSSIDEQESFGRSMEEHFQVATNSSQELSRRQVQSSTSTGPSGDSGRRGCDKHGFTGHRTISASE